MTRKRRKSRGVGASTAKSAALAGEMMLAPMVVAMRIPILVKEAQGINPWRAESVRAVAEKAGAMMEGALAAQFSMIQSMSSFWLEAGSGRIPSLFSGAAAQRSLHAALAPAGKQVKSNCSRLGRKG